MPISRVAGALGALFCAFWLSLPAGAHPDVSKYHDPYVHLRTQHIDLYIESEKKDALAADYPTIESALEYAWRRYTFYTGYDPDQVANQNNLDDYARPLYVYEILDPQDMWWKGWTGGLTIADRSQMGNELAPEISPDGAAKSDIGLRVMWHELANGWGIVREETHGVSANLPSWYEDEGHSGFMKHHALIDSGYRKGADQEYAAIVASYDAYITAHKAGKDYKGDMNTVTQVLLQCLWVKYGWTVERYVDNGVQTGAIHFADNDPEDEKNGEFAFDLVRMLHQDILPFLDKNYIPVAADWRARIAALDYPPADIPIARDYSAVQPDPSAGSPWQAGP